MNIFDKKAIQKFNEPDQSVVVLHLTGRLSAEVGITQICSPAFGVVLDATCAMLVSRNVVLKKNSKCLMY